MWRLLILLRNARLAAQAAQLHHAPEGETPNGTNEQTGRKSRGRDRRGERHGPRDRHALPGRRRQGRGRRPQRGQRRRDLAVAKAQGHGDGIAFVRCDVAKEADVAAMVAEAVKRFGRLDIAYLNAGVGGAFGPIAETSVEDWDYTFAVLARSVFLGMKHASLGDAEAR